MRKAWIGFIASAFACFGVGCLGIVAYADQSTPPDYSTTAPKDRCPTEDSCKWVPVSAWHWDWVPVVP
jgi:hypothetical protein